MTAILLPLGIGIAIAIGCFVFARTLDPEGASPLSRGMKVAGVLVLLGGAARGGWVALRDVEAPSLPSISAIGTDLVDGLSPEAIRRECLAGEGFFEDAATARAECECTVSAVQTVRQSEPTFAVRVRTTLQLDGTDAGLAAFRAAYGACVSPQLRSWISEECQTGCEGELSACERGCDCVAEGVVRGQSDAAIGAIFWPERVAVGESEDHTMHNLIVRAGFQCGMQ